MKKLFAFFTGAAVMLTMIVSVVFAAPPPVLIDCHLSAACGVYVDDTAAPGGDGTKAMPFQTITEGVNYLLNPVNTDYDRVFVAEGTYSSETLPWIVDGSSYSKDFHIYGGYNSTFTDSDPVGNVTKVQAASSAVIKFISVAGSINGLDISAAGGSAISVQNNDATTLDVTISNNVIHNNTVSATVVMPILLSGSNTATVNNNVLYSNTATDGLISNFNGKVTVYNNVLHSNTGGSLKCSNGANVYNNFILGDAADWLVIAGGSCTFEHNTVAHNDINSGTDHGVIVMQGNGNLVRNNLIAYDAGDDTVVHLAGDTSTFDYNALFANSADPALTDNNISCDPLVNPVGVGTEPNDQKLGAGSTCIDMGKDVTGITKDYFGNTRQLDGNGDGTAKFDPGAYEAPTALPTPPPPAPPGPPSPPPPPADKCAGFTDVPASHPDCDAITYVKGIGAMTGNPDGTFAPNGLLQRDQIAKIALETFSKYVDGTDYCGGTDPFPDVTNSAWSYQYICRGKDIGMITGYLGGADAGFYRPGRSVNRVEFLALLLRNLSDAMPSNSSTSYSDVATGQWYSGYARYSMDNSLFTGSNLFPTQATTRVEVASVIFKLHNLGKI